MTCRGCLTHPALCKPGMCPDAGEGGRGRRKAFKVVTHTLPHGKERRNGERQADVFSRRAPETEEEKRGQRREVLGRMGSQDIRYSGRIKKKILPTASDGQQGKVVIAK